MKIQKTYTICIACFISFFCLGTTIHAESFKLWGKQIRSAPPEYQGNTITLKETAVISNVEGNAVNYTIWRVEPDEKDLTGTQTHDNTDLDIGNQSTDPPQTVSGGLTCSGDLKEAYQQHMEAYNHLNYLISRGKGGTSQAQRVYEKHKFYKDCYTRLTQNELDTQQPDGDIVQPDYPGGKITPPKINDGRVGTGTGGNKEQQIVLLVGNWVDKNGHKVSIAQNGQNATATAQENKGPVGWKTAPGEVKGNTVYMNFNGWNLTGDISSQGNKISWSNKSIWTRVLSGSGSVGQPGEPSGGSGGDPDPNKGIGFASGGTDTGWQTTQKGPLSSINPKAEQWNSTGGGFMVMNGSYHFDKQWYRRTWGEKDPFYSNGEDTKRPPQHSYDEVMKHAIIKLGQITVRGPGALALFVQRKGYDSGAWIRLYDTTTGQQFWPQSGGALIMFKSKVWEWKSGGWRGRWSGKWTGKVNDLYADRVMSGYVPPGQIKTYEIKLDQGWYNNMNVQFGSMGFGAPQEIDYELWYFPREGGGVKVDNESTSSDSSSSTTSSATKESYSWADWELICPQPWKLAVSTGGITIGTRKLYRCVYNNLSAPLRTIESRTDGTLASDTYHVVFFTDTNNPASLTSRTVRRLGYDANGDLASEALNNIYLNDKKGRWESANRQTRRWNGEGIKYEEINHFNLQHHSGIWDSPVKNHTRWFHDGVTSYQHQYEAVENPDHWRSVHIASVSYNPDGRLKMRYEDYLVKQNSDGYWNSFPTHVMTWSGKPSYKNGDFVYEVVQQPSGVWTTFEKKFLTLNNKGEVTDTRLHEIYLDPACNCYKSKRL